MSQQLATVGTNYYVIDPNVTNDHSDNSVNGSIQWAIDTIDTAGGYGTIELVPGVYTVGTGNTITASGITNLSIVGSPAAQVKKEQLTNDTRMMSFTSCSYLSLKGFDIYGWAGSYPATYDDTIYLTACPYTTIDNIHNTYGMMCDGFTMVSCYGSTIQFCQIRLGSGYIFTVSGDQVKIIGNQIYHRDDSISITLSASIYCSSIDGSIISGNVFHNESAQLGFGHIYMTGGCDNNAVIGNHIYGGNVGKGTDPAYGLINLDGSDNNYVAGNYIGLNRTGYGVLLSGTATVNQFHGNMIHDNALRPVYIDNAGCVDNAFTENYFLANTGGNTILNSGTGTIDDNY